MKDWFYYDFTWYPDFLGFFFELGLTHVCNATDLGGSFTAKMAALRIELQGH